MNCEWLEGLSYSKKNPVWLSGAFMERVCWLFLLNSVSPLGELMLWRRGGADGGMELVMDAEQNCSSCPGGAQTSFLGAERKLSPCSESFFIGRRLKAGGSRFPFTISFLLKPKGTSYIFLLPNTINSASPTCPSNL